MHSTLSGTRNITASAGSVSLTTAVTFDPGNPNTTQSTLTASPDNVTADGTSTTTVQLTLRDAFNNAVPNVTSNITSSGTSNTIAPASQVTNSSGLASFTIASTKAELKNLVGHGNTASPTTSVTFVPNIVSTTTSSIVANPNNQKAGSPIALLVTAEDAQGNLIPNQSVSLSGLGTNNTFTPASGTTDANGTFSSTLVSTKVQTETIRAIMDGKNVQTNVSIYAADPNATTSTLTTTSSTATADGSQPVALTLTLKDDYGNLISGYGVTFSTDGTNSTLTPASGTTNSSGVLNSNVTSNYAQNENAIATAGGINLLLPIQFTAGQASSLVFTASPNSTTVSDGSDLIVYLLTAKDGNGNPITNQTVTFRRSTDSTDFDSQTSDSNGQASVSISSKTAGDVTVIATIQSMSTSAKGTFVPGDPNGAQSTFTANPNAVVADGTSESNLAFTALDAYANPIPNLTVSFSATGTNNTFSATSATTDSSGNASVTLVSTTSEVKTAQGQLGSIIKNTPVTFLASTPNQTLSSMVINPNSAVADGSTSEAITVTLKDRYGNLVSGQSVSLSASGGNNTFSPISGTTNSSGVFTSTLVSTLAQNENVTATFAGKSLIQSAQFVPGAADASQSTLVASPDTVVANGNQAIGLVLTVRDLYGNAIPGQAANFSYTGANTTLSPSSGTSNASGQISFSAVSTKAQNENIRASLTSTAINLNVPVYFTAGNSNVANTTFSASPNSLTANGSAQSTLTITIRDDYMNPVPNKSVSFSSDGNNNTFSSTSGTTDSTGTWSALLASTKAQLKNLTATYDSKTSTTQVTFVAGSPNSALSSFVINPNQLTADGSSTSTLTTTLKDNFANAISGTSVSYTANGNNNTFGAATGSTNSSGVYTTTLASTLAQSETVQSNAGSGALVQNGNITFLAGSPSSSNSTIVANPNQNVIADGSTTSQLTVTVRDAQNNPVPSQTVTLSSSGTSNTWSNASFSTDSNGMGTATLASTVAQTKTVTASFGSASANTSVVFVAGAPVASTSTWTASPNSLTADGNSQSTLTLTLRDINNNVVKNQNVTYASSGSNNTFSPASGTTSASGVATTNLTSTKAETKTVTATFASINLNVTVVFNSGSVSAAKSSLIANPNSLVADGNATSQLTVTALDAYSNPVNSLSIALAGSGSNNVFSATSGTTNASGQFLATLKTTYAQSETLTATLGSGGTPPTATAPITFIPGPSDASKSSFVINPNSVVADNVTTATMTVTARDAYSNVIPSASVSLSATGSNNTISNPNGTTDPNGVYSTTLRSSKAESKTVNVTITP